MTVHDLFGEARRERGAKRRKGPGPETSEYARIEKDGYNTPPWCVDVLVRELGRFPACTDGAALGPAGAIPGPVWEPACGRGLMAEALRGHGLAVVASDIGDYGFAGWVRADFLHGPIRCLPDGSAPVSIVTNPPFKHAEAFAERALAHMLGGGLLNGPDRRLVALLLPEEWDCARGRADLFDDPRFGFAAKIVLRTRIVWIGPDGRPLGIGNKSGPTKHHAWFVWDRTLRRAIAAGRGPRGGAGLLLHQRLTG